MVGLYDIYYSVKVHEFFIKIHSSIHQEFFLLYHWYFIACKYKEKLVIFPYTCLFAFLIASAYM